MARYVTLISAGLIIGLSLVGLFGSGISTDKLAMPDLEQTKNNCVPTSAANLMLWFGENGFPQLMTVRAKDGKAENTESVDEGVIRALVQRTKSDDKTGTPSDQMCSGLAKYVHDAGYGCTITYRGLLTSKRFDLKWLDENRNHNTGFLLLFAYVKYDDGAKGYKTSADFGHAVTLVAATENGLLVNDPQHVSGQDGKRFLEVTVDDDSVWREETGKIVAKHPLFVFNGEKLEAPPGSRAILTGAIRIVLLPNVESEPKEGAISL